MISSWVRTEYPAPVLLRVQTISSNAINDFAVLRMSSIPVWTVHRLILWWTLVVNQSVPKCSHWRVLTLWPALQRGGGFATSLNPNPATEASGDCDEGDC